MSGKKKQRKVTDAEVTEWRRLRKQGKSLAEIANKVGRDRTVVRDHVKDIPYKENRRREAYDAATIAEARAMKAQGLTYEVIGEKTGMSPATLSKVTADIAKPKSQTQITKGLRQQDQDERRIKMADQATPMFATPIAEADLPPTGNYKPDHLPPTAEGLTIEGIFPDDNLIIRAYQVQDRWLEDRAKGHIFDGVPVEVFKAQIITSTTLRPWDSGWMRTNRPLWDSIRKFTTLNVADLSERMGISASSFTRYAAGSRTPNTGDFERICVALWAAMQERLWTLDLWLCLEDYVAAHDLSNEDPYNYDDALRWITGLGPDDEEGSEAWEAEQSLDNLPSLAHVRSLMPAPLYRDEDSMLYGHLGYGDTIAEAETGAA